MRALLYDRFGPKYTASTAVLAVANLKQRGTETCADFIDRCILAVDKTYYAVPPAVRGGAGFPAVFAASILSHFGAGLRPKIAKVFLSAAAPLNTAAAMLTAAETVKAELSKKTTPGASALAVAEDTEEQPQNDKSGKPLAEQSMMEKLEELVAAVNRFRPRAQPSGRGCGNQSRFDIRTVVCYNCRKKGHFQRNCPEPQMAPHYSRGRRPFRSRAQFGRDRATFHVEEDDPRNHEQDWQEDQWFEDVELGNY